MIASQSSPLAISMFALAACQPSMVRDAGRIQEATATVEASQTHSDCEEMPWHSAKSNCEASYEALAAEDLVDQEFRNVLPVMDAADREWASQKWRTAVGEPTYHDALIQSQSAWTAFRDAQCQIEKYEWRGGASEEQRAHDCEIRMNREREAQLQKMRREF